MTPLRPVSNISRGRLNPVYWQNNKDLKPQVSKALLAIANFALDKFLIDKDTVKNIVLTGSNAGYDFKQGISDLDIHFVIDDPNFDEQKFRMMKKLFDYEHDLQIYGSDIEIYFEKESDSSPKCSGRYSLVDNKWLQNPCDDSPVESSLEYLTKLRQVEFEIRHLMDSGVSNPVVIKRFLEKLRKFRTEGIRNNGIHSVPNAVYRKIRDMGLLDALDQHLSNTIDRKYTL